MTTALRVGLLVSGVLHVAALVGVSVPFRHDAPSAGAGRSIMLRLAVSQPPAEAPSLPPAAEEEPVTKPVAEAPPPVLSQADAGPSPEPAPVAPKEPLVAEPPKPRPPVKTQRVAAAKPIAKKQRVVETGAAIQSPMETTIVASKAPPARAVMPVIDIEATQHYLAALAAQIDRRKFYPGASRRRGEEGMVVVGFVIQRNGEFTDLAVVESSGHRRLDEAALKTLRRVAPFERIPEAIGRDRWPITVPIAFSLRG